MTKTADNLSMHANAMYLLSDPKGGAGKSLFSIGDLSREFGVTLRALRFYEAKGLLNPQREGASRLYSRRDRARLKMILMGKSVGFSLKDIREMLDYYDLKDGGLTQLKVAKGKCEQQLRKLKKQRLELDNAVTELARAQNIITNLLNQKEGKGDNLLVFTSR